MFMTAKSNRDTDEHFRDGDYLDQISSFLNGIGGRQE